MTFYSFPITKTEEAGDGSGDLIVWGKATDGTLDSDGQIVDPEWSCKALQEWYDTGGNVRVQHQAQRDPAGKGIDIQASPEGTWVKTRVVEPVAVRLVRSGVLQDYSVGIMNPDIRRGDPRFRHLDPHGKAVNGVITGREDGLSKIAELSLVDRGSNFGTRFQLVKAAADGSPEWVGELTAPDDVLARVAEPAARSAGKAPKSVNLDLPAGMSLSVKPSDLAKLATFRKKLAAAVPPPARKAAVPAPEPVVRVAAPVTATAAGPDGPDAAQAAEPAVYKRDIGTAARQRLAAEGNALGDGSYPIENAGDLHNAAVLARSGHGDAPAARRLIARRARELGVPNPLKSGKPKAAKAAEPDVTRKKKKMVCPGCGAMQSRKHAHCTECSRPMAGAPPVTKNHDHMCLKCGKTLDKGERFCPGCGKDNPGYLPVADRKVPMNADKAAKPGKGTVSDDDQAGRKGRPSGGAQSKPSGKKGTPVKAGKRKKSKPAPGDGVTGEHVKPVPAHREPDGPAAEALERDARMRDGDQDQEMAAAMRHKALAARGVSPSDALLHDLTCPAFSPGVLAKSFPSATLAQTDDGEWRTRVLADAASAPLEVAGRMMAMWQHAVTLKTADPDLLADLHAEHHMAFLAANKGTLKAFRDAAPGPGTYPAPGHVTPGQFRRPYITEGHASPSPQSRAPAGFPVPDGQPSAADYHRDLITAGHAADAPANDTPRHEPQPAPGTPGKPGRVFYQNTMRDNARQAMVAMHDHISHLFPDVCPMSPDMGHTQKPGRPVPAGAGAPAPHSAGKAARRKAAKAAAVKAAKRKTAKVTARKARKAPAAGAAGPGAVAPQVAATAPALGVLLEAAVIKATAPLLERVARQDKILRRQRRVLDVIAGQPDTSRAPYRGAVMKASPGPAAPVTAGQSAELAQTAELARLSRWREIDDPALREATLRAYTQKLGLDS
jgi:hypothetical protein